MQLSYDYTDISLDESVRHTKEKAQSKTTGLVEKPLN